LYGSRILHEWVVVPREGRTESTKLTSLNADPIDVIKVRLQLQKTTTGTGPPKYNGFIRSFFVIFREEGLSGLGRGLAPALLREATYSGIRLGLYDQIRAKYILKTDENGRHRGEETLWKKIGAGMISGGVGCGEFDF